jgi:FixJ family two-component response regulator
MTSADTPTVFIVDDDGRMRAAMQRLLKSVGLHSESFATPQDFLRHRLPDGPSCLVLDVRLPGMSGLEVQHKLNDAEVRIPIIFITGPGAIPMTVRAIKFWRGGISDQAFPRSGSGRCDSASSEKKYRNQARAERDCAVKGALREVDCRRARGHASDSFRYAHETDRLDTGYERNYRDGPPWPSRVRCRLIPPLNSGEWQKSLSFRRSLAETAKHVSQPRCCYYDPLYLHIGTPITNNNCFLRRADQSCTCMASKRKQKMVAIIEDDESYRVAVKRLLKSAGFSVQSFACAEDFLSSGQQRETG